MTRLLVIEDDQVLRRGLAGALRRAGYTAFDVGTADAALRALEHMPYQVVLLDLGLPDMDGLALLPRIRQRTDAAILVVSARRDQSDKVRALDLGADDYITKPFGLPELLARLRAVGRRVAALGVVRGAGLAIDLDRRTVTADADGRDIGLTQTEWAVLDALVRAQGRCLSAVQLLEQVWGEHDPEHLGSVRVYINSLRRKLESDPAEPVLIRSRPGQGYWLAAEGSVTPPAGPSSGRR